MQMPLLPRNHTLDLCSRKSRQWRDQHTFNGNKSNYNADISQAKSKRRPNNNTHLHKTPVHCDDVSSAASTVSTAPSSDASRVAPIKKTRRRTRRRKQKKQKDSAPRVVQISELTDEEKAQYIALDAEMVGVGPLGTISRLARVSLVNYDGETIYDTMVKVDEPVTDYRTFVSGITAKDLESESALPFIEVHQQVSSLINNKIIVGHGLKNDLRVLCIQHPWHAIRDTAKYEPFTKPCPISPTGYKAKKLATLAKDKLGMIIQEEGQPHSSVQDAIAALELYKKHRVKWECAMQYKMNKTAAIIAFYE